MVVRVTGAGERFEKKKLSNTVGILKAGADQMQVADLQMSNTL